MEEKIEPISNTYYTNSWPLNQWLKFRTIFVIDKRNIRQLMKTIFVLLGLILGTIYALHDQYQWFNVQQLGPFTSRTPMRKRFYIKGQNMWHTKKYWQVKENDREINDTHVKLIIWNYILKKKRKKTLTWCDVGVKKFMLSTNYDHS
jgi:hypothetical protein